MRAWQKKWPHVARNGNKSYQVGYYDHNRRERTKTFPSASLGRDWMRDYSAAERRGLASLRRFLLDLDAEEANGVDDGRTIGEVIEMYFALDADPELEGGLARATFVGYTNLASKHILGGPVHNRRGERTGTHDYAVKLANTPAVRFNRPDAPRNWRSEMLAAGRTQKQGKEAWKVLSAALSWAAGSHLIPEIQTNGCLLANERRCNRRRSERSGGTGRGSTGRRSTNLPSWALSPQAVEAIREEMLARVEHRDPILALRDATIVSLQYGLGARPQEVWGLRWTSVCELFADIMEVISWGELDRYGKTAHSTERRCTIPSVLWEDLNYWRAALRAWGHPARDLDFIIPGDLGGAQHGIRLPDTGACHLTLWQAKKWGRKYFNPAVAKVAQRPQFADVAGATPYSMRRGGISVRLRAEDAQTVARECGTSLQMLDKHYAFAIDDLRRFGPRPFSEEWREARDGQARFAEPPQLVLAA